MYAVVESRHIHHLGKTALQGFLSPVHALCDGTSGVKQMTESLQMAGYLAPLFTALFRNLVADAPHDDARVVAVGEDEVLDIAVAPVVEETGIAVFALRIDPHIKAFCHHHHTQRVADIHLHLTRHIVRCSDGVTAHLFHQLDLSDEGGLVDGGTERSQVVVQTDTLDLPRDAIQLETAFFGDADGADTHLVGNLVQ